MIPLEKTPIKLYFREKTGKIKFSGNSKEDERIFQKKKQHNTLRQKQRKEQSKRKKDRDMGNS
jgi:GTP-binding protein